MRRIADENTSMSMSGAANTTAPILCVDGVAISRIELAQAFERQHGSHAVRHDVDSSGARGRHDGQQHALEVVAGPHRAFAIIGVVEEARLGRPGEHHRLAAEFDAVGELHGIERRRLERVS